MSVRKNKLGVLVEVVRLVEKLQNEVSDLRKKEKEKKRQGELLQKLKIVIPKPSSVQQEYYTYIHNSGTNVVIITASGLIVDANAVFCNSINRDYSSVIGASFFSFAHVSTLPSLYTYPIPFYVTIAHLAPFCLDRRPAHSLLSSFCMKDSSFPTVTQSRIRMIILL